MNSKDSRRGVVRRKDIISYIKQYGKTAAKKIAEDFEIPLETAKNRVKIITGEDNEKRPEKRN